MPIATVSFAAAFTMPGGYNNGGPDKGMPIFKDKLVFKAFVVSDALAFAFSLGGVILHSSAAKNNRARVRYNKIQQKLIASAIIALAIAFASGIYIVLTKSNGLGWTGYIILACLFLVYQIDIDH
ncbi:ankyrin repeat-containing protein ITN1-like [Ricinus communis]|uniref:ankyrin repeat-containing protein ITN1-like n=1 Tax=Ricinus communis TaxID=3988 RepID=UPI00201B312E|nr:ankyrin repeat-containing protein ITN1-like [Ricinus communis]